MVVIDQWFKSAIVDNSLVAHLLLCLKHSSIPQSPPLLSHWGANKPRSSVSRSKHHPSPTAFSPTTPLSWTASADGYEHSTHHIRSKDIENKKASFVAQRAGNETIKRRKLDLGSMSCDKPNSSADEDLSALPRIVPSTPEAEVGTHPRATTRIVIPDLNMMPP
nr:hypothetical protein [Lupinus angustifolius]